MSGRSDNNKAGSSGRGGNQNNQGFGQTVNRGKFDHGERTGEKLSVSEKKKTDQFSDRNTSLDKEKK